MPEGDTVWQVARQLDGALAGRLLSATDFRVPRLATVDLAGRRVLDVVPRGKHLLMRFSGGLTLHSHLRMDGRWLVRGPSERRYGGRAHEIRVILTTAEAVAVGYRLPVVELLRTADEDAAVGFLGPDLLGPGWDAAEAVRRLSDRPAVEIGPALHDQRNLAGLGNVYVNEVCFLRGISPWTPVGEVPRLDDLVDLAHRLITANRERHGHVTTGDTRPGRQNWVYGRAGKPCLRCGTMIRRAESGPQARERVTFWCPRCQAGPNGRSVGGA